MSETIPVLVAHRGYPSRYPENTAAGILASLQAGACFVEFDIQLSVDGVPVVIHDQNLRRTAGVDVSVHDNSFAELRRYGVGESEHLHGRFADVRLPSLAEIVELFQDWPRAQAVVEIKRSSLRRFGRVAVGEAVNTTLGSLRDRSVLISFDYDVIAGFIKAGIYRRGWIIDDYSEANRALAETLKPEYLVIKDELLPDPPESLWPGAWQWMVYTVDEPQRALDLAQRGADLVETNAIVEMLKHPLLKQKACIHDRTL